MSVYVAADIGCIECGESSDIRVFTDEGAAKEWLVQAESEQQAHWTGQHHFSLYECPTDGEPATSRRWVEDLVP